VRAATADGVAGAVFNVARGRRVSLNESVAMLRELTGRDLDPIHAAPRPGDVRDSEADISNATKFLGFAPRTDLLEGLRLTIEHLHDGTPKPALEALRPASQSP
jgi:UDP-glucose 4-epimerase